MTPLLRSRGPWRAQSAVRVITVASCLVATTLVVAPTPPAQATRVTVTPVRASTASTSRSDGPYVALGDSYSAGVGTRSRTTPICERARFGYPRLIAAEAGLTLDYQACAGATIAMIRAAQVPKLTANTRYVTITAGGNDVGFLPAVIACALPASRLLCGVKTAAARRVTRTSLAGRLGGLFADIRRKAPTAAVVVSGYPRLFSGRDCSLFTFFATREQRAFNAATDEVDEVIRARAAAAGFGYVDVRGAFDGHGLCTSSPWLTNLIVPLDESFHPNREGNRAYASALAPRLLGSAMRR
ncbi:MAG TPA: SGNH/GDSL hydrolase family protein [Dermatophilaceae bacterium]|nr:SGNH/GDSL hydrolase family protein [Dermatophilaceae bacterium]